MGEKKFARTPLLYIQQPSINKPNAMMQHTYKSPKNTANNEPNNNQPNQSKSTAKPIPMKRNHFSEMENATFDEKPEELHDKDDVKLGTEGIKFKDMTLQQRIDYFVNKPKGMPGVRCEVATAEKSYRGVIVERDETDIYMQVGRRTSTTKISIADINEISLLGFK